jgi:bacteriorhodopsin
MSMETWFLIGTLGMILGAAAIFIIGKQRTPAEQAHTIISGIVPVIAAASYFAMAAGQGSVVMNFTDPNHPVREIFYARYIDWAFTTPLLLTGLALLAMHGVKKRWGVIFGLVASDMLMIVTSLCFALTADSWTRCMWFVISCGAFFAVYYGIWCQLRHINKATAPDVQAAFKSSAVFLSVVWFAYPVVLAVGTDGLALVSPMITTIVLAFLDLVAKVVFGLRATAYSARITALDLSEKRPEALD